MAQTTNRLVDQTTDSDDHHAKKKRIELRYRVQHLYHTAGLSKCEIARQLKVSRNFVSRWTIQSDQDLEADNQGWPKGKSRRWDESTRQRIVQLHQELTEDSREFYSGATAIAQRWRVCFNEEAPALRSIGRMMAELGLSTKRRSRKNRGAAAYLCYPEYTLYERLATRLLEMDFIGQKFITGDSTPLNFLGFSFKKEPRLRHFRYVEAQTTAVLLKECQEFFEHFERPDFLKVDNAASALGSVSGKRTISRFMQFLLQRQIVPVFAVPRKPFTQASIEGNNSVFARNFWNSREFSSIENVCEHLHWFNESSLRYTGYEPPSEQTAQPRAFLPRILFLRQVHQLPESRMGMISVMNEQIELPESLINYFVLADWRLETERLYIYLEKEHKRCCIHWRTFPINVNGKYSHF